MLPTIHTHRNLRTFRLKVLSRRFARLMRIVLVFVMLVVAGGGFGGGGRVLGDFFVDALGRFFFGRVDRHGGLFWGEFWKLFVRKMEM